MLDQDALLRLLSPSNNMFRRLGRPAHPDLDRVQTNETVAPKPRPAYVDPTWGLMPAEQTAPREDRPWTDPTGRLGANAGEVTRAGEEIFDPSMFIMGQPSRFLSSPYIGEINGPSVQPSQTYRHPNQEDPRMFFPYTEPNLHKRQLMFDELLSPFLRRAKI